MLSELEFNILQAMPATLTDIAQCQGRSRSGVFYILKSLRKDRLCFVLTWEWRRSNWTAIYAAGRGCDAHRPKQIKPQEKKARRNLREQARRASKKAQTKGPFAALFQ